MTGFIQASPLQQARRFATKELRRLATPAEVRWLYERPLLWLRVLTLLDHEVDNHIAKSRRDLADIRPTSGTAPSREYLKAKAETDKHNVGRLHFKQTLAARIEEVKALIGTESIAARMSMGDLIELMVKISDLAEKGDTRAIRDLSTHWAGKWTVDIRNTTGSTI